MILKDNPYLANIKLMFQQVVETGLTKHYDLVNKMARYHSQWEIQNLDIQEYSDSIELRDVLRNSLLLWFLGITSSFALFILEFILQKIFYIKLI